MALTGALRGDRAADPRQAGPLSEPPGGVRTPPAARSSQVRPRRLDPRALRRRR
ncbi:hypothetical protein RGE_06120 [Rubrivivax gelatinosus IL144]|uniref:Uncharacterized protein n=1 Tax=Rubrivivax gelatinosus (strain NBRC 100245 / IL144) TaxID=983917 RepID=I0HLS0_RUBGI|nr:hypothetical protein RGE_06120 [Rubrivivax gelatinosus IL144]